MHNVNLTHDMTLLRLNWLKNILATASDDYVGNFANQILPGFLETGKIVANLDLVSIPVQSMEQMIMKSTFEDLGIIPKYIINCNQNRQGSTEFLVEACDYVLFCLHKDIIGIDAAVTIADLQFQYDSYIEGLSEFEKNINFKRQNNG